MRRNGSNRVVLPERAIVLLRQFTDDSDRSQWGRGDLAAALVDELYLEYGKAPVRERIAIESGLAPETVRDNEAMARFFSPLLREKYEVLTYHQFRALKSAGSRWQEYAEWAVTSMDDYGGRTPPVTAIRQRVKANGDAPAAPAWQRRWARLVELAELLILDDQTDRQVRIACKAMLEQAEEWEILPK